jgi:aminopeptidase N
LNKTIFNELSDILILAASVLRMFDHSFGHKIFVEALQNYLDSHKYKNARPEFFSNAIQARLDKEGVKLPGNPGANATAIITSWTTQPGYPVVNATRRGDNVYFSQV